MIDLMTNRGVGLVASYVLAGGTLTGKYIGRTAGRASDDDAPPYGAGKRVAVALSALAREWGVTTSQFAFCYAFSHPCLASALFGATSPEQLRENVASHAVYEIAQRRSTRRGARTRGLNRPSATIDTERSATIDNERSATVDTERSATVDTERSATVDNDREPSVEPAGARPPPGRRRSCTTRARRPDRGTPG